MSRLTNCNDTEARIEKIINYEYCGDVCKYHNCWDCPIQEVVEKLAHYEDLEEQGRLIELPCKVGDAVYEILPPCNDTLLCEMFQQLYISRCINKECGHYIQIKQFSLELLKDLGRTVFATKAEAEARLAELKGGEE